MKQKMWEIIANKYFTLFDPIKNTLQRKGITFKVSMIIYIYYPPYIPIYCRVSSNLYP